MTFCVWFGTFFYNKRSLEVQKSLYIHVDTNQNGPMDFLINEHFTIRFYHDSKNLFANIIKFKKQKINCQKN